MGIQRFVSISEQKGVILVKTGYVYHELFGWHDTGTNTGFFPSDPARGLQPFANYENAETKKRIHELIVCLRAYPSFASNSRSACPWGRACMSCVIHVSPPSYAVARASRPSKSYLGIKKYLKRSIPTVTFFQRICPISFRPWILFILKGSQAIETILLQLSNLRVFLKTMQLNMGKCVDKFNKNAGREGTLSISGLQGESSL